MSKSKHNKTEKIDLSTGLSIFLDEPLWMTYFCWVLFNGFDLIARWRVWINSSDNQEFLLWKCRVIYARIQKLWAENGFIPPASTPHYFQLFYDFGLVWSSQVFTRCTAVASDFIWLGHRFAGIQFYDSCDPLIGPTWLVYGANEDHPRSRNLIGFCPFMIFLFKQPFKLDYLWAGLCLLGCIYFVFRSQ